MSSAYPSPIMPATPSNLFYQTVSSKASPVVATVIGLVISVLLLLLFALVAKWLWNKTLVPSLTIAKPINSVWTMLGILVLIRLLTMKLL